MMQREDRAFNIMLLTQRIIVAAAFLFLTAGETLHFNAFIQNAIDMGLPYPEVICTLVVVLGFVCPILILIGLGFRYSSTIMAAVTVAGGAIFFVGQFNKVNIVAALFALALLCGFVISGPGEISLIHWIKEKRNKNAKKRLPRH